jgi:uncharacterized protein YwgA
LRDAIGIQFRLHHYGPYSAELAEGLDRMSKKEMLVETAQDTTVGRQFNYSFNDDLLGELEEFERSPDGRAAKNQIEQFAELLDRLKRTRPRVLELASTLAEFWLQENDWQWAQAKTSKFKSESEDSQAMQNAFNLAQEVISARNAKHGQDIS